MDQQQQDFAALSQDELDEAVHEAKAAEAATINNAGREAQIAYLTASATPWKV